MQCKLRTMIPPDTSPSSLDWILRALQGFQGLRAQAGPSPASVSVFVNGSDRPIPFEVRYFPVLSRERAIDLVKESRTRSKRRHRLLLATRQLSEATRELLRSEGVSWAEQLSNVCRLVAPGLLVEVKAEDVSRRRDSPSVRARLRGRSGLVGEALLLGRRDEKTQLGRLAQAAGVSTALASRLLKRLTNLKLLEAHGAGPNRYWRLVDVGGLLDLWASEEQPPPVPIGVYVWTRSATDLNQKLSLLDQASKHWALSGTAAANVYAPTLTVIPELTVWFDARVPAQRAAHALGGEIVDKGANLYLWQSDQNLALKRASLLQPLRETKRRGPEILIVSRPRAYVEAIKAGGRSAEVAQSVREKIISYASN